MNSVDHVDDFPHSLTSAEHYDNKNVSVLGEETIALWLLYCLDKNLSKAAAKNNSLYSIS